MGAKALLMAGAIALAGLSLASCAGNPSYGYAYWSPDAGSAWLDSKLSDCEISNSGSVLIRFLWKDTKVIEGTWKIPSSDGTEEMRLSSAWCSLHSSPFSK